ncbi:hypothetical protein [Dictyobacter formicarum]|nr:hypothetical protein [Dictyobacter formicarum]
MGINYSYELYFPKDKVWDVLNKLVKMEMRFPLHPAQGQTTLWLPDGEKMVVPFSSHLKTDPIYYTHETVKIFLDASFWLYVEESERKQFLQDGWCINDQGYIDLGNMDLTIDFKTDIGQPFVQFSFVAVTDGMSFLFELSLSIRRAFETFLIEHKGICGIIDREDYQDAILWWANNQMCFEFIPGSCPEPDAEEESLIEHFDLWCSRRFDERVRSYLK